MSRERGGDSNTPNRAIVVIAIGLAHFVVPGAFDPINRLGFPARPRTFTFINGAIETLIGVLMAIPRTKKASTMVSAGYGIHLVANIIRSQRHGV
ncbi:hypothetical protein [Mycobacterium sp. 94-17]|uniref:hypothetical protein n=1 Tax=Mycobacterium sp. 94-17 TaxID=2986147 RepID=UPI002D1E8D21|nr:hypothetical protein [Mycobacterium sp. 94-17]MEB4208025.1 hypothetical protein [Mycobacterium sp. 94-17]